MEAASNTPDDARRTRILLIVHPTRERNFYDEVVDWIRVNLPSSADTFDLRLLGEIEQPAAEHAAVVLWLQDPVQAWSMSSYRLALALTAACDARGVPVINRVDQLSNAGKSRGALLMRRAGLQTARVQRIVDPAEFRKHFMGLRFPLFVREDWGHGSRMLPARRPAEARTLPVETFRRPIAVELLDVASPDDGLFRKYRYVVAGSRGVPHHVQVSDDWVTRGRKRVTTPRTRQDELDYIGAPSPHHGLFHRACEALGLDFAAFDYGLDADGAPVVWEANPFPLVRFSRADLTYRNEAIHRTMAIMVAMYFERASLPLPPALAGYLAGDPAILPHVPAAGPRPAMQVPPQRPSP
ncbi:hypothetical protein [Caenimonas aquaedulcis]|uniref:ATP-grasp domain-containing protein n=1 Tax=Caenimonas aquaedulcis TaxID=2793270 RepID=A0A931H0Y9_9BURK|nr:hypothetical protein [Caenimonas aquaedulcis]MBG9386535.1 hypothetical protein [Caenimonas aquaedulcis]